MPTMHLCAKKEIVLIDGYIDITMLNILAKKNVGVDVFAYMFPNAKISTQDINNFNAQYPTLTVKKHSRQVHKWRR